MAYIDEDGEYCVMALGRLISGEIVLTVFSGSIQLKYRTIRKKAATDAATRYGKRKKPPRHKHTMPMGGNTTRSAIKR